VDEQLQLEESGAPEHLQIEGICCAADPGIEFRLSESMETTVPIEKVRIAAQTLKPIFFISNSERERYSL